MDSSAQSVLDGFDAQIGYNPSLILFWGGINNDVRQKLKADLDHRVPGFDDGLFALKGIELFDSEAIIKELNPLFSDRAKRSFWQSLFDEGLIVEDLVPNIGQIPKLQLIVIIDTESVQSIWEKVSPIKVIDNIKASFSANFELSVVFILLGNKGISIDDNSPRFRLARHKGDENREINAALLSTLSTFLVLLLSSRLIDHTFIEHGLNEVYIGASTVKVNKQLMGDYFNSVLYNFLVYLMKEKELEPQSKKHLMNSIDEKVTLFDLQRTAKVFKSLPKDWQNYENERISLIRNSQLADLIESPREDFYKTLSEYLVDLENRVKDSAEVTTELWEENFRAYLVRLLSANPKYKVSSDDKIHLPVEINSGLATALFYLDYLTSKIKVLRDVPLGEENQPQFLLSSQQFYELFADEIHQKIDLNSKRVNRLKRRLTSIPGLIIYSVIFWSLLSFLFASFFKNSLFSLSLISLVITLIISLTQWIVWKIQNNNIKNKIQIELSDYLEKTAIMPIIRRELKHSRLKIFSKLINQKNILKRNRDSVQQLIDLSEKELELINRVVENYYAEEKQTFNMFDSRYLEKQLEFARNYVNKSPDESLILGQIIANTIINHDDLMFHSDQLHDLVMESVNKLRERFYDEEDMIPYSLINEYPKLKDGKIWKWLYLRALPVGEYASFGDPLATHDVILAKDSSTFIGGFGFQSPSWPENCLIEQANTYHEIICIRMVKVDRDLSK